MSTKLSLFDAALLLKISPDLLKWCTSYSPKTDGRKLQYESENGLYFFEKEELIAFDAYLSTPWVKDDQEGRAHIPAGIEREIKEEAGFRCPACNTNAGEIAHIVAVTKTKNNHPHNLIYLCPDHHTVYDYGHKYDNLTRKNVEDLKSGIHIRRVIVWKLQRDIIHPYLGLINDLKKLDLIRTKLPKSFTAADFKKLASSIINLMSNQGDANSEVTSFVQGKVASVNHLEAKVEILISSEAEVTTIISKDDSLVECPLCDATGRSEIEDVCPVCVGDLYVDKNRNVDLSIYKLEECPICLGSGNDDNFDACAACAGIGSVYHESLQLIDVSEYQLINCPVCAGDGFTDLQEECQPCGGNKKMARKDADRIDLREYEVVSCPLCKGNGSYENYEECPACNGNPEMFRKDAEEIDISEFTLIDCPVCEGSGSYGPYEECMCCAGERTLTREGADSIDLTEYELIDCPQCEGAGYTATHDECPSCVGNQKMIRKYANELNF